MPLNLSQKEKMLLSDQKNHEQVCIQKYNSYANQAQDPQLKQLFNSYSKQEQEHLNSVNQMLNGQIPNISGQQNAQSNTIGQMQSSAQAGMSNSSDASLCNDMLMTEKYVSGAYDTSIFEFRDTNARNVLNHIQKEEQQHGEGIFNYMQSNGMYQTQ
jgi:Coat F domain.